MGTTNVLEIGEEVVEDGNVGIGAIVVNSCSIGSSVVVGSTSGIGVVVSEAEWLD